MSFISCFFYLVALVVFATIKLIQIAKRVEISMGVVKVCPVSIQIGWDFIEREVEED